MAEIDAELIDSLLDGNYCVPSEKSDALSGFLSLRDLVIQAVREEEEDTKRVIEYALEYGIVTEEELRWLEKEGRRKRAESIREEQKSAILQRIERLAGEMEKLRMGIGVEYSTQVTGIMAITTKRVLSPEECLTRLHELGIELATAKQEYFH